MKDDELIEKLRNCANGIGSLKSDKGDYGICDDAADAIEALTAEVERLGKLLVNEREEVLWNAYATGHEKNGRWTHLFMSDGEWLVRQCDLDPTLGDYDAEQIKAAIPIAARAALQPQEKVG